MTKDFLSILDFTPDDLDRCLALAKQMKRERVLGRRAPTANVLDGRHAVLLFEKPSLRTRATFTVAIHELGGDIVEPPPEVALGGREAITDVARNLERWVHFAVIRTFAQRRLVEFAAAAPRLHVVNALTDEEHPCQALADYLTLEEHLGSLRGKVLAFVGDGNNVAASLAHAGAMLGVQVRVASPDGFDLPDRVVDEARRVARFGGTVTRYRDPAEAVAGADAVYTDVWASMGQEADAARRRAIFQPYRVDARLMARAGAQARFMHCLPAHRGDEVTDEVIDSPASIVYDQAENRLHTEKALLAMLVSA
jgi:ornithine carbamoyltransferase